MGAWPFMALKLPGIARPRQVLPVSLPPSSAPATGSAIEHSAEHRAVVAAALDSRHGLADPGGVPQMYFTDRGIEELASGAADDEVSLGWLAERLREFVDLDARVRGGGGPAGHLAGPARRRGLVSSTGCRPSGGSYPDRRRSAPAGLRHILTLR